MTELKTPGIVDSGSARRAADNALATGADDGRLPLGALPDEAMVALVGEAEQAGPLGEWYRGLSTDDKQLAQSAALRTMTTFDSFAVVEEHPDGNHEYEVAESLLAALHLRLVDAALVAQRVTEGGMSWLSYRAAGQGMLLREVVSPQGYHAFLLTRPDEAERAEFLRFLGVSEGSVSEGEPRLVREADLSEAAGLDFLTGITHVTTLARSLGAENDLTVVHASDSQLYLATPGADAVTYRPEGQAALHRMWDEWVQGLADDE